METKVLVVGENSFIGNALCNVKRPDIEFYKVSHKDFDKIDLPFFDTVVGCALNPEYRDTRYSTAADFDFYVANKACKSGCHFIMLSTRKVYGSHSDLKIFKETDPLDPFDYYSINKLRTETRIQDDFGDQSTIIRGSNLFGFEYGRNSFFGYLMNSLVKSGEIVYNIHPSTRRDFIHVDDSARVITEVCVKKPSGVYNLGAGEGLPIGLIGAYLVQGYGKGNIRFTSEEFKEQFILDTSKLTETLGMNIGPYIYRNLIIEMGEHLCKKI